MGANHGMSDIERFLELQAIYDLKGKSVTTCWETAVPPAVPSRVMAQCPWSASCVTA
jgi:hypothetical protein